MADEYIRLDTTIIAIDRLINEAATGTMARTLFKAKDVIYSQQKYAVDVQPVNQWISVDDRLPEDVKIVLVWYTSDTIFGFSEGYGLSWYSSSVGWNKNELNGENIAIRYWQPLPEAPKEDSK